MSDLIGLIEVKAAAESFLRTVFLGPSPLSRGDRVNLIRPTDEDYALVFGANAESVKAGYAPLWTSGALPEPKAGQTDLAVFVADPKLLSTANSASDRFPGGYRKIAHLLDPGTAWVALRYTAPGSSAGMLYDGLVPRPDGRFVWFPKPWRVLDTE